MGNNIKITDAPSHATVYQHDENSNLILATYYKNNKSETADEYTFDETNKMVEGVNANRGQSIYSYGVKSPAGQPM